MSVLSAFKHMACIVSLSDCLKG